MGEQLLFDLSGRIALITGAPGGIGSALSLGLGLARARLALNGRTLAALQQQAAMLRSAGIQAGVFPADVSRVVESRALVSSVVECLGQLDILVNVTGTNRRKPAVDFTAEDWDAAHDLNLKGLSSCRRLSGVTGSRRAASRPSTDAGRARSSTSRATQENSRFSITDFTGTLTIAGALATQLFGFSPVAVTASQPTDASLQVHFGTQPSRPLLTFRSRTPVTSPFGRCACCRSWAVGSCMLSSVGVLRGPAPA
jgi:NAD(P)-dependent dehydrogenase (short-subunit alcohol dehydrogenase family)